MKTNIYTLYFIIYSQSRMIPPILMKIIVIFVLISVWVQHIFLGDIEAVTKIWSKNTIGFIK